MNQRRRNQFGSTFLLITNALLLLIVLKQNILVDYAKTDDECSKNRILTEASEHFMKLKNMTYSVVDRAVYTNVVEIPTYDMSMPVPEAAKDIECILLKNATPPYYVCLHDNQKDVYLSKHLRTAFVWEPHIQELIKVFFDAYPEAMYIDLGMNIGTHTLYAATVNDKIQVLSVEPFPKNVLRAHKAAHLNKVQNRIKVVMAAISDKRGTVTFHEKGGNIAGNIMIYQGSHTETMEKGFTTTALLFNDLAPLIKRKKALLKMDIEGQECHAFFHAEKIFDEVDIPIVLMEILYSKKENSFCFEVMLSFLQARNYDGFYFPFKPNNSKKLDFLKWRDWYGRDVYFQKSYVKK